MRTYKIRTNAIFIRPGDVWHRFAPGAVPVDIEIDHIVYERYGDGMRVFEKDAYNGMPIRKRSMITITRRMVES